MDITKENIGKLAHEILNEEKRYEQACKEFGHKDPITMDIYSECCGMMRAFYIITGQPFNEYLYESEED